MRKALVDLFKKAIVFEYSLPHNGQNKSSITSLTDDVFSNAKATDLSALIYNSIVDLAFEESKIDLLKLDELQTEALLSYIKFDESRENQGFFGETVLNVLLQQHYGTGVLFARGNFYDPLSDMEPHGFDSHHFVVRDNKIEFWFGEAKFYQDYGAAIKSIISKLSVNLSKEYLKKNFLSIIKGSGYPLATTNLKAKEFIEYLKAHPLIQIGELIEQFNPKIIYPALVISNKIATDCVIKKCIEKIEQQILKTPLINEVGASIFFTFLPVADASAIKKEVLAWIKSKEPLI